MLQINAKQLAAEKALDFVQEGMVIGLGTGSTAYWAIQRLGQRVQDGLRIEAIATSIRSETLAREAGIPITGFSKVQSIDLAIDGADEVDPRLNLIKGGGGSLLREKIVAAASKMFIVIIDESKLVPQLGKFPLPVEVVPFGWETTQRSVQKLGCTATLRLSENKQPFVTDNGNYTLDCSFGSIPEPEKLYKQLKLTLGLVEAGLFFNMADRVIVGRTDGSVSVM